MNRSNLFLGMKIVRFAASALALLLGAQGAWAACKRFSTWDERFVNMDMGRVTIPNDLAVNAVIARKKFPIAYKGPTDWMFDCLSGGGTVSGVMLQGDLVPGSGNVYTTKVPGVGIRLSRTIHEGTPPTYYPHDIRLEPSQTFMIPTSEFQVELIKIASTTGNGPLAAGTYTRYFGDGDRSLSAITTTLSGDGITIITPSCSVDLGSRNISVEFGKVPQNYFKGRGSVAGERKFNIKLNCKAGQNAQNTVYLRMDATADPSSEQGVLKITQAGTATATGVGIQVIDNQSVPVKFGSDMLVGPSTEGDYVLPYTARYFQTGDKVTPGRADGTATFTLDYK